MSETCRDEVSDNREEDTAKPVRLVTAGTRVTLRQINPALCFETISLPRRDLLLSADIIKLGRTGSLRTPGGESLMCPCFLI